MLEIKSRNAYFRFDQLAFFYVTSTMVPRGDIRNLFRSGLLFYNHVIVVCDRQKL